METVWVGTSWKMNKTLGEALAFADALAAFLPELPEIIQPFVIPPFTAVREVKRSLAATRAKVGAQNMHWADDGAWTGEISPLMLTDCGLDLVELGHSERREHFAETDHAVGLKTAAALHHGLTPLICVGETLAEREEGRADAVLTTQVEGALQFLDAGTSPSSLTFAYEPVWAIGESGIPASSDYAEKQHALIKRVVSDILGGAPRVLYGGSVSNANAAELIARPDIDGLFIGRAAWAVEDYIKILKTVARTIVG
jgi:triosephosphate isomerase